MADRQAFDNSIIARLKEDPEKRNAFLTGQESHVLRLTGKIVHKRITVSDDEYVIALSAVDEAIDRYEEAKGDFWPFASYLIKNRLYDHYRKENRRDQREIPTDYGAIEAGISLEGEDNNGVNKEVLRQVSTEPDNRLKDEIVALTEELADYGVDFFAIAQASPRAKKTRDACEKVIRAIFLPPPLVELLRRTKKMPHTEIRKRVRVSQKLLEKYRSYLVMIMLIIDGDYPGVREYVPYGQAVAEAQENADML